VERGGDSADVFKIEPVELGACSLFSGFTASRVATGLQSSSPKAMHVMISAEAVGIRATLRTWARIEVVALRLRSVPAVRSTLKLDWVQIRAARSGAN
jgi:hypothetical protein